MDYSLAVRVGQRIRDLAHYVARGLECEPPLAVDPVTQRFAAHVWHYVVEQRFYVSGVVERKNVRVLQPRQQSNFSNETELTRF